MRFFHSTPPFAWVSAALLCFGSPLSGETLALWTFEEFARGTPLEEVADKVGGARFEGNAPGVATDGKGSLRIRRPSPGSGAVFAALPEIPPGQPVWLTVDLGGWHFEGKSGEFAAFGFADGRPDPNVALRAGEGNEIVLAEARLARTGTSTVRVDGRAWGNGATHAQRGLRVPVGNDNPAAIALRYDPSAHGYAVFYKAPEEDWKLVKQGATDPMKTPRFLRLNFFHPTNDTPRERVEVTRIVVGTTPPDGMKAEPEHPFVTAWSWAVCDAETGEIIDGHEIGTRRKSASITKAMTAFLIAELAVENPEVLDERVELSGDNESTRGSTSGLAAGDALLVRDALYALMLPSGNDIGNALAEHFNDRFAPPEGEQPSSPPPAMANFIAEMNRRAAALGMKTTEYRSAFGDGGTADERTTSARDLLVFAGHAMANPVFREIVGTKRHTGQVIKPGGGTREAVWTNTNFLLGEDGVNGIKTGTTNLAKACLLGSATLDNGRDVFFVVLGSESSNRRYVDARNILKIAELKTRSAQ